MTRHRAEVGTRRRGVTAVRESPHLRGLSLEELRAYRRGLTAEEDRTSYWRRVVHARIDVLEAESRTTAPLTFDELVQALGDTGNGRRRKALVRLRDADPMPELPVLAEMWVSEVDPRDEVAVADALERLATAERQLTTYRRALHECIDEATAELIVRYRADPTLALAALPRS